MTQKYVNILSAGIIKHCCSRICEYDNKFNKDVVIIGIYKNNQNKNDVGVVLKDGDDEVWVPFACQPIINKIQFPGLGNTTEEDEWLHKFKIPIPLH